MGNLNKEILANEIAEENEITKVKARKIVDDIFDKMEKTLLNGDEVLVNGFGKFSVKERSARKGYNPSTKQEMEIAASKVGIFKIAKKLKDSIKNS